MPSSAGSRTAAARAVDSSPSAKAFLGKVLLWLPVTFTVWYWLAPLLIFPVAVLLRLALGAFYPEAIAGVEQQGYFLDIVTRFSASLLPGAVPSSPGQETEVFFTLNALKYGYGIPLLLALLLAVPQSLGARLVKFMTGMLILIPVQTWGVYFETLINLLFKLGPTIGEQLGSTALSRNGIALAYQLGYLILPAITPLIVWAFMSLDFIRDLAPNLTSGGR